MSTTFNVDALAEREAEAIDRLADMLGEGPGFTRLQLARFHAIEAAERGLPKPRRWFYRTVDAVNAWLRILERITAGDLRTPPIKLQTSFEDRRRQLQRKINRLSRLNEIRRMSRSAPPVDLQTAVRLSGIAERTLFKAMRAGELPALHIERRTFVRPADLKRVLERRLAKRSPDGRMPPPSRRISVAS